MLREKKSSSSTLTVPGSLPPLLPHTLPHIAAATTDSSALKNFISALFKLPPKNVQHVQGMLEAFPAELAQALLSKEQNFRELIPFITSNAKEWIQKNRRIITLLHFYMYLGNEWSKLNKTTKKSSKKTEFLFNSILQLTSHWNELQNGLTHNTIPPIYIHHRCANIKSLIYFFQTQMAAINEVKTASEEALPSTSTDSTSVSRALTAFGVSSQPSSNNQEIVNNPRTSGSLLPPI